MKAALRVIVPLVVQLASSHALGADPQSNAPPVSDDMVFGSSYIQLGGAFLFGAVIGWLTGETLKSAKQITVAQLGTLVGVLGGAAVTRLFHREFFGAYCIGLGVFFFWHVLLKDRDIQKLR